MRAFVMIVMLQLVLIKVSFTAAIDHPIRHRHSERKSKNFQSLKNSTLSRLPQKLALKNGSKLVAKSIVSMETKSDESDLKSYEIVSDSDASESISLAKGSLKKNIEIGESNYFTDFYSHLNSISSSTNHDIRVRASLEKFRASKEKIIHRKKTLMQMRNRIVNSSLNSMVSSSIRKTNVKRKSRNQNIYINSNKLKSGHRTKHFHLPFDDYQSDSSSFNDDHDFQFTRHNITVESPNQEDLSEQETSLKQHRKNKVAINSENSQWSLSFPDISSKHNLNNTSTKILAPVGGDALLPCRVGHLGDRQVSWIRRRDWFVLTSGDSMYAHSSRFLVLHEAGSQDWTLHIKRAVKGDSGMYECQVSTGTGIISFFVKLEVVIPTAHIPGNGRSHVYRGSPFTIFCYIMKSPSGMQHVMWHHNGEALNYQRERQDFKITNRIQRKDGKSTETDDDYENDELENEFNINIDKNIIISRLKVPYAKEAHSGNYSCSGQNIEPAFTLIYVTEGDKTAAVQRSDSAGFVAAASEIFILIMIMGNCIIYWNI